MLAPQTTILPDGKRLHLQHGPIDLIIEAFGDDLEVSKAYRQASFRFQTILNELVAELAGLRSANQQHHHFKSPVALSMQAAIRPYSDIFVTPMAAVAGAVAQHVLDALLKGRQLEKAYVNNGGDIALYLSENARFDVGIVSQVGSPEVVGKLTVSKADQIAGIATSGWQGRSLSLGIADAVTVLASSAAEADVAATLIANQVNLEGHPAIRRIPALEMDPDSDLGAILVTVEVAPLVIKDTNLALDAGANYAKQLISKGLIKAVSLCLNNEMRILGLGPHALQIAKKEMAYA